MLCDGDSSLHTQQFAEIIVYIHNNLRTVHNIMDGGKRRSVIKNYDYDLDTMHHLYSLCMEVLVGET